jgi:hypothetical protein
MQGEYGQKQHHDARRADQTQTLASEWIHMLVESLAIKCFHEGKQYGDDEMTSIVDETKRMLVNIHTFVEQMREMGMVWTSTIIPTTREPREERRERERWDT